MWDELPALESVESEAAVNYLFKYYLYCVSTALFLMCMKGLTCNLVSSL